MDKISPIKENILYYIDNQNIKKEDFYKKTGISASNFKGPGLKSEIGGDKIVKILSIYDNISSEWLLTGQGEMLKNAPTSEPAPQESHAGADELVTLLRDKIALLEKNNALQEQIINLMQENKRLTEEITAFQESPQDRATG